MKSNSARIVNDKHKATGCKQRLYVSIQRRTVDVLRYEKKQGKDYVARGLVASFTFTGSHNHLVMTADSGRHLPTTETSKAAVLQKFKQVRTQLTLCFIFIFIHHTGSRYRLVAVICMVIFIVRTHVE